jgi:hypothetical protein
LTIDQIRPYFAMLFKERGQINNQILDNPEEWQRLDDKIVGRLEIPDKLLASQLNPAVYHKSIRTADTVSAGIAVAKSRVLLPPYLVQTIKDLVRGRCFNGVLLIPGLFVHRWVEAINYKSAFHLSISFPSAGIWLW